MLEKRAVKEKGGTDKGVRIKEEERKGEAACWL